MPWVPLHVHSQYSILNSTIAIEDLVEKAKSSSLPALALTDEGNMYGTVEFYKACKEAKIKPIIGCELHLAPYSRFDKKRIPERLPDFLCILAREKSSRGIKTFASSAPSSSRGVLLHAADR